MVTSLVSKTLTFPFWEYLCSYSEKKGNITKYHSTFPSWNMATIPPEAMGASHIPTRGNGKSMGAPTFK